MCCRLKACLISARGVGPYVPSAAWLPLAQLCQHSSRTRACVGTSWILGWPGVEEYVMWPRSKLLSHWICVMHGHAEALIVVIFPSCIGPGRDIKRYHLIELKWDWELTGKFFEVLGGFCVLQQEQNHQTRYVHPSFISTQAWLCWPSAALGSGAGRRNVDWHDQSGALHSVWGVAETQKKIKSPLIAHCWPKRCCAKADWFMNSSASPPGVPRAFVCVFLTCSLWVWVSSSLCL